MSEISNGTEGIIYGKVLRETRKIEELEKIAMGGEE